MPHGGEESVSTLDPRRHAGGTFNYYVDEPPGPTWLLRLSRLRTDGELLVRGIREDRRRLAVVLRQRALHLVVTGRDVVLAVRTGHLGRRLVRDRLGERSADLLRLARGDGATVERRAEQRAGVTRRDHTRDVQRPRVVDHDVVDGRDLQQLRSRCTGAGVHGHREGRRLVDRRSQGERSVVRPRREAGEVPGDGLTGTHGCELLGLATHDQRSGRRHVVRVGTRSGDGAVRLADHDTGVGLSRSSGLLVGRRRGVGARQGDLRLRRGHGLRLRVGLDLVQELDLLDVDRGDLDATPNPDDRGRRTRGRSLSVAVQRSTRALQRRLHLGLDRSLSLEGDVELEIARVPNLDDGGVHLVHLATHVVEAREHLLVADPVERDAALDGVARLDLRRSLEVERVLVEPLAGVPLQDGRELHLPGEATDDTAVLAGVADDTARLGDDDRLALRLLGDGRRLLGTAGVLHRDVRRRLDRSVGDAHRVVGIPPQQLRCAVDHGLGLLGDRRGVGRLGVADALTGDAGVGVGGGHEANHQADRHEQGEDELLHLLHDVSLRTSRVAIATMVAAVAYFASPEKTRPSWSLI